MSGFSARTAGGDYIEIEDVESGEVMAVLAPWVVLDPLFEGWLREDVGRGDRTTGCLSWVFIFI